MKEDQLFKSAFNHSSIGMALVSPNGKWLDVNPALGRILGYEKDELLTGDFQNITHPEDLARDLAYISECLAGKRDSYELEKRYFHKDGQIIWTLLTVSLIRENGVPSFFISQIQDITENKNNQHALIQATKLAALGEIAGTIAHEVNNPLTIISGQASLLRRDLMKRGISDQGPFNQITKINDTIKRISSIIQSMKNLSRDGSNEKTQPCRLQDIIQENMALCNQQLKNDKIEVVLDIDENIYIEARPIDIGQSLINLIVNARHAMKNESKKVLTIKTRSQNGMAKLYVTDTGHGIPENLINKIMDPFFTTKPKHEGTGMGLSITRKLLTKMNAQLKYIHSLDKTTTFCIEVPLAYNKAVKTA